VSVRGAREKIPEVGIGNSDRIEDMRTPKRAPRRASGAEESEESVLIETLLYYWGGTCFGFGVNTNNITHE
jgi:hypothetical protein